jgi:hypothetical protein
MPAAHGGGMSIIETAPEAAVPAPRALQVVRPAHGPGREGLPGPRRPVVLCSFHTPDAHYAGHARALRDELAGLGVPHEIVEVDPAPGQDWADVTRHKLGIMLQACRRHPDAMVLWIDVDCRITHLPDWVRNSTADVIGFQRGFSEPLRIGYHQRTRFWEPSFWGVNATPGGRRLIADAHALEQRSALKATDDYFLEEAWRANARTLTFQVIPSTAVIRGTAQPGVEQFFAFGSSGNVAQFRDRVVQHEPPVAPGPRAQLLARAKRMERALPDEVRRPVRRAADTLGLTGALTAQAVGAGDPHRRKRLDDVLAAAHAGHRDAFAAACAAFDDRYVALPAEVAVREAAEAFLAHRARGGSHVLPLAWWAKPYPGNFGDWLSPWTIGQHTEADLAFQPVTAATRRPHLVAIGSIGRFIRPSSVVVGTGISREDIDLAPSATYVSVRGPITAAVLRRSGGPRVEEFGDPAVLMSRLLPIRRTLTNGRIALVRHHAHRGLALTLPDHVDELAVTMSRPQDLDAFLHQLARYDAVLTSAMHVLAACQSYGIPCGLVTFAGGEDLVHGTGIKYEDYARGVEVTVRRPQVIGTDLRGRDLEALVHEERISEAVQDRVEAHLRSAIARTEHLARRAEVRRRHPIRSAAVALLP